MSEHRRTVGRLVPAEASQDEKLDAMRRAGLIRWNGKKLKPMKPVARLKPGRSLARLIVEERQ